MSQQQVYLISEKQPLHLLPHLLYEKQFQIPEPYKNQWLLQYHWSEFQYAEFH